MPGPPKLTEPLPMLARADTSTNTRPFWSITSAFPFCPLTLLSLLLPRLPESSAAEHGRTNQEKNVSRFLFHKAHPLNQLRS